MSKRTAVAAIIMGVVFNNYVYLHDIVVQKHAGFIHVGLRSVIGIAVAMIVIAVGVRTLARASSPPPAS